jgi:hypothetical protein
MPMRPRHAHEQCRPQQQQGGPEYTEWNYASKGPHPSIRALQVPIQRYQISSRPLDQIRNIPRQKATRGFHDIVPRFQDPIRCREIKTAGRSSGRCGRIRAVAICAIVTAHDATRGRVGGIGTELWHEIGAKSIGGGQILSRAIPSHDMACRVRVEQDDSMLGHFGGIGNGTRHVRRCVLQMCKTQ